MTNYTVEWQERSLRLTRPWRDETSSPGGRFALSLGIPRLNVGLYIAVATNELSVRYVGKVRRPRRFNALAMRIEEHHHAGEMGLWGDYIWIIPLRVAISEADVLDAEALLIDLLDPPENKTHRRGRGAGGRINRGLHHRAPRMA